MIIYHTHTPCFFKKDGSIIHSEEQFFSAAQKKSFSVSFLIRLPLSSRSYLKEEKKKRANPARDLRILRPAEDFSLVARSSTPF